MNAKEILNRIWRSAVAKNYSHMTATQIAAMAISVCVYPYVIRRLGVEAYGLYVFGLSITSYFLEFTAFGLKFPSVKATVELRDDTDGTNRTVMCVYIIKGLLALLSCAVFCALTACIPLLRTNALLFGCIFTQILGEVLMPNWFYQGRQKMQIITYMSVGFRLLTVPFIFIFVKSPADVVTFAVINTAGIVAAAIGAMVIMVRSEGVRPVRVRADDVTSMVKDALPFFGSNVMSTVKTETVTLLIGSFLGMKDVAIYDLANKMVTIPRTITQSINQALFPAVLADQSRKVKKIIRYEYAIGFAIIALLAAGGYWAALLLGGREMVGAYPISLILSVTILTWLVVGAYIAFVFVPQRRYYLVTRNQLVALLSFLAVGIPAVAVFRNVYALTAAFALSGVCEIVYCIYVTRKQRLL